jgi:dTDP-4-dehydrorhamnose 3,5-epimerase
MLFHETPLPGAFLLDVQEHHDERGFFARTFCRREFQAVGLNPDIAQCNLSFSRRKGTLRGMHWQVSPHQEAKLVSCLRGAIYDVIIDLREESPTYLQYFGVELSSSNHTSLYIPEGFAHGFQTLHDETEVFYQMSQFYSPEHQRGIRWDDPAFGIAWPPAERIINERDRSYPLYSARTVGRR